ncbi:MAG: GspH/FimT family pseudopilin [Pseudomonadota bacterium]
MVRPTPQIQRGLTLIELLAGLALLATVLGLAIPALRDSLQRNRLDSATRQMQAHLALARSQAIHTGRTVTMAHTGSGWSQGWVVFHDPNRNARPDQDETIITRHPAQSGLSIEGNGSMARYVAFSAQGSPTQVNGAFLAGTFLLCTEGGARRALVMNKSGRVRLDAQPAGHCSGDQE